MRQEERREAARRKIKAGKLSYEEISDYQNLTVEEIKELADEISDLLDLKFIF